MNYAQPFNLTGWLVFAGLAVLALLAIALICKEWEQGSF